MADKKATPPPIDRPVSKSYLREFTGWSTAYSPGLSDSTSLRQMANVLVGRDKSAKIRPALRLMFDTHIPADYQLVGSFEQYVGHNGNTFILYALRKVSDGSIKFYRSEYDTDTGLYNMTLISAMGSPTLHADTTYVKYLQINNRIYCLGNSGADRVAVYDTTTNPGGFIAITGHGSSRPTTPTLAKTGLDAGTEYNYAFFYTVVNEFGESKPSALAHTTSKEKWTGWDAGDKIAVSGLPATGKWNLYFVTWSEQSSVPVEGQCIKDGGTGTSIDVTTAMLLTNNTGGLHMLPSDADQDFSTPPICAQGLVAADRLILVNDFENRARIRWSSNEPGSYGSFSPGKGGGYKTLSSGNLQIPYGVELWQNPQSVDTLTILCRGLDGYHSSYYMSPAAVTSQNEELRIMGFEETTATPGTTSPWGNLVFNNALYHPLDDQLMKSTANNYNINHKTLTDSISNKWLNLKDKRHIISSQFDGRLYYIVNNPDGDPLEPGCIGNEIWVCDAGTEGGNAWSRYTIGGCSLRRIEHKNKLYIGVVRPEGIYRLDELFYMDELPGGDKAIQWYLQTNPVGANSARDSWVHLQRIGLMSGNFYGTMRYGIQSWTVHGKPLDKFKVYRQPVEVDFTKRPLPFDHEDYLQIRHDVRDWLFVASSVVDPETGETLPSHGQINQVQATFTPVTVNVGYEFGSIETYEYSHSPDRWDMRTSINGIPIPYIDARRP